MLHYATLTINKKGKAHFVQGPLARVLVVTNESRPPPTTALTGALIFNGTVGRLQICTGDRWRNVVM